jgi:hypothetical protein
MRLITKICGNYCGRGAFGTRVCAMNSDTALEKCE